MGWRSFILIALLLAQAGAVGFARFDERRYFCWAPHDQRTSYAIAVTIDDKPLTDPQVRKRYRIAPVGEEFRATVHTLAHIEQYERVFGRGDNAQVTVTYRVNGGPEQQWHWPQP